jgi:hypothetical protein
VALVYVVSGNLFLGSPKGEHLEIMPLRVVPEKLLKIKHLVLFFKCFLDALPFGEGIQKIEILFFKKWRSKIPHVIE